MSSRQWVILSNLLKTKAIILNKMSSDVEGHGGRSHFMYGRFLGQTIDMAFRVYINDKASTRLAQRSFNTESELS